ncbi:MAG: hypothetical protein IT161_12170 [Bryobacterales bacterium]|nr:hypothetical protein [Bryobacterales bacterium]
MTVSGGGITALDWQTTASPKSDVKKAAQEFEALLLTQILQGMKSSLGEGLLGSSDSESGSQMIQLGQEMIAHSLSQSGGVGLAKLVQQGLTKTAASAPDSHTSNK